MSWYHQWPWRRCISSTCPFLRPGIKNLLSHFGSACQMLSKMVWHDPMAPMTMQEMDSSEKDWNLAKSYPVGTGQWYYPMPTHKLVATRLVSPENLSEIDTGVEKLFNIFRNIDRHTKWITPLPYIGVGEKCYILFFYLFTHYVSSLRLLTPYCWG